MPMEDYRPAPYFPSSIDIPFLWIHPPIHKPEYLDPPLPLGSILLEPFGYFSDSTNDTTAQGFTKGGNKITVTFWAAQPPRISYFTVCSPDLEPASFGDMPKILTTEDDLVLLRVPICPPGVSDDPWNNNYFVYRAGTENKQPSLDLILTPTCINFFSDYDAGLLPCRAPRDMDYIIALLLWTYDSEGREYHLHLYNSKTKTWSNKLMYIDSPPPGQQVLYSYSSKVITIGGELGSVGWVDLWYGIVICDVLLAMEDNANNKLRYIPLPSLQAPWQAMGPPLTNRDIIVFGKTRDIKYFEMQVHIGPGTVTEVQATTWIWNALWSKWENDCIMQGELQPTLKGLYAGYPAFELTRLQCCLHHGYRKSEGQGIGACC